MKYFAKLITEKPSYSWLIIVAIVLLVYSHTVPYKILYNFDDDAYFNDKSIQQLSIAHTKQYFSENYLGMYQPLPVLSFAITNAVFTESIPAQRILNILLHCINTLLVLLLIRQLSSNAWVAWLSALIFAIHPMHVESVTWLSTRSNLMFSAFYLLALIYYLKALSAQFKKYIVITFLFFILALLSKVTAATLPFVLILFYWNHHRNFSFKSSLVFIPFLILSALFVVSGVKASGSFGHISELSVSYSFIERVLLIFNALWLYLIKSILPINLSAIYLFPLHENSSLPTSYYITGVFSIVLIIVLLFYGLYRVKKHNDSSFLLGVLFFLITISIVLPLKWSRTVLIAERYTYLPYLGITYALLLLLYKAVNFNKPIGKGLLAFLSIYILALCYQAYERNKVWETPISLFTDVIIKNRAEAETAMGYFNRGNEYLRLEQLKNAEQDYSDALRANPSYSEAYFNRGLLYFNMSRVEEAIKDFTNAIQFKPNYVDAYVNRGVAYRATGSYDNALRDFDFAISKTQDGKAYFNRGVLYYLNLSNPLQACTDWQKAREQGIIQADELLQMYCK